MAIINRFSIFDDDDNDPYHLTMFSSRYIIKEIAKEKYRNWLDLPQDVLSFIFIKLGALDILYNAQFVCSSWQKLSKEPHLFRSIDLRKRWKFFYYNKIDLEKIARVAVDRSCGQLAELSMNYFGEDEFLNYVINKSNSLKCLRISKVSIEYLMPNFNFFNRLLLSKVSIECLKKIPYLEELELCADLLTEKRIEEVGRSCSQLKYLLLDLDNGQDYQYGRYLLSFHTMRWITAMWENIPQLRCLYLCGSEITYKVLQDMLNCLRSFQVRFREKKYVGKIKCLRLPTAENYFPKYVCPKPEARLGSYMSSYDDDEVNTDLVFLPKKTATCYL